MSEPLLTLEGLTRRFDGLVAVDGVSTSVAAGAIHGLIGPNGAGKTTLFNMISGLVRPSAGTIRFAGREVAHLPPWRRAGLGLARTFQALRPFAEMTVLETVLTGFQPKLAASIPTILLGLPSARREERRAIEQARALLDRVGLADQGGRRAGTLSHGDQRRAEIARALAGDPKLLLLDEPAAGMNPSETDGLARLLQDLRADGLSLLLVEHDIGFVMELCDRVSVLNFGRLIAEGTPEEVREDPRVIEAYLGANETPSPHAAHAANAVGGEGGVGVLPATNINASDDQRDHPHPGPPPSRGREREGAPPSRGREEALALRVEKLSLRHGSIEAVHGIDLTVAKGSVVTLIGANGAGKTSTLRGISGLLAPAGGRVWFNGVDITGWRPERISRAGLGHVPEGRQLFVDMTIEENLAAGGYRVDDVAFRRRRDEAFARFPRLAERRDQRAGSLSGGEQQMLAISRALMSSPSLLLLDEPSMGLAPKMVSEIFAIISELKAAGTTILLVEQNARAALDIADHAYVMETGRITLEGPSAVIARDEGVAAAYLGARR